MIHIPNKIDIGGITYKVSFVNSLPNGEVAQIRFIDGEILIENGMSDEVSFVSLVHEIVHGMMQGMNHHPNSMIYNDESFIEQTAQYMTSIFKQLVDYNMYMDYRQSLVEEEDVEQTVLNIEV